MTKASGYRLPIDDHGLDARTFEDLLDRGRAWLVDDPSRALESFDEALGLIRGPAYGELATHPEVATEAVRLERLRSAGEADRVDAMLAVGRHTDVLGVLGSALTRDPPDERAHRQLMLAQHRSGRTADALALYHSLRGRLRDALGVDPSPQVRDLHRRILQQDPSLGPPDGPREPAVRSDGRSAAGSGLIGREHDLREVTELASTARLVTLTGPGGVGKTRLADRVATGLADRYDDVVRCELAGVRDAEDVGDALITTLGIQPTGGSTTEQILSAALGERRLLLLLDNCEHVLPAVTPLAEAILRECPHVLLLTTSRERLHLADERIWQVAPLSVPDEDARPEEVIATAAGALFQARAEAVDPHFEVTATNGHHVGELCRRLDGMPLAIERAAARMQSLTLEDLVARLDRRFALLAGGPQRQAGRHRTLQAVVAWSYDLLEPEEAELFQRLSVFAGPFSLAAAEDVCAGDGLAEDSIAGLLGNLVDRSMVITDRRDGRSRYRLLDTLREFGGRHLDEAGRGETQRRAHARYHVEYAEEQGPRTRGPDERDAVTAIDAVIDDLRAAHGWLLRVGDIDGALRLPAALGEFAFFRLRDEVTTWARRAAALPGAEDHPTYAAALTTAAQGATNRDECPRAEADARQALAHTGPDGDVALSALSAAGVAAFYEGRLGDLGPLAERQALLAERLDQPYYRAFAEVLRVPRHSYQDEHDAAQQALPALDAAAQEAGNPTMQAFAHYTRGEVHLDVDPASATDAFEQAVALARQVENALIEGVSLVSLASLLGRRGETEHATRLFREVVMHWRRLGDHTHQLTTLRNLVDLLARVGADDAAAEVYGAVTAEQVPTFGLEAKRLADAWARVSARLGQVAADQAVQRGRMLTPTEAADRTLRHLDMLLDA